MVFISTAAIMSPLIPLSENKIFFYDNYISHLNYNYILRNLGIINLIFLLKSRG